MVYCDGNLENLKTDIEGENKGKEGRDKWKLGAKFNSLKPSCLYYHKTELPVRHFRALVLAKMVYSLRKNEEAGKRGKSRRRALLKSWRSVCCHNETHGSICRFKLRRNSFLRSLPGTS